MLGISEEKKNNILKKLRKNNFKILSIKYDDDDEDDIFNNNIKNTTNKTNTNNKNNNKPINNKPVKTINKPVKTNHTKTNNTKEEVKPKHKTSLTINQSIMQQKKLNKLKK